MSIWTFYLRPSYPGVRPLNASLDGARYTGDFLSSRLRTITRVPGGIRTPNLLIRSQLLYPVELQTRNGR